MFDADEMDYCRTLVATRGNSSVGRAPSVVASYLRLQAANAFRVGDYEAAARLGQAATKINWSADNDHVPRWGDAVAALGWRITAPRIVRGKSEAEMAAWRKEHGE